MVIAFPKKNSYLMFLKKIFVVIKEVNDMSKSQDAKKNKKTAPQKTAKEKKLGKQEKKKK
jgi:large-conductance mechanosensitive channel